MAGQRQRHAGDAELGPVVVHVVVTVPVTVTGVFESCWEEDVVGDGAVVDRLRSEGSPPLTVTSNVMVVPRVADREVDDQDTVIERVRGAIQRRFGAGPRRRPDR